MTILDAVEELRKGVDGMVKCEQHFLVLLTRYGLGYEVQIVWNDQPPESYSFLEENQLLTWWSNFDGEWLL